MTWLGNEWAFQILRFIRHNVLWKEIWISASSKYSHLCCIYCIWTLQHIVSIQAKKKQEQKRKYKYNHFKYFLVLHKINWIRLDLKF